MFEKEPLGIKNILLNLGLIEANKLVLFSNDTRDKKGLSVWR